MCRKRPTGRQSGGDDDSDWVVVAPDIDHERRLRADRLHVADSSRNRTGDDGVYEIRSGRLGSTAFVVGGMHGNEESGYWAASDIQRWKIDTGTLVVLPEANAPAVKEHRRKWPERMDLNRQFPIDDPPKNALARSIWRTIVRYEPDVLVDLHSSKGILKRKNDEGVGQTVFRSRHGKVVRSIRRAVEYLNDEFVTGYESIYDFVHTPVDESEYATAPMLINKARRDRDILSCLFEVT